MRALFATSIPAKPSSEQITAVIDAALTRERSEQTPRDYLGASRLGHACERALQYEYAGAPVDSGRDLPGRVLRIFEVGRAQEDLAIRWLRLAGFELYTQKATGGQFGFAVAGGRIQGHVDGILATGPGEIDLGYPALWECKTMNDKSWRDTVKHGVSKSKTRLRRAARPLPGVHGRPGAGHLEQRRALHRHQQGQPGALV